MNMYFRLTYIMIISFFRKKLNANKAQSELSFRVSPFDLDILGHMNNGRMLTLCDLGKTDLMVRLGMIKPQIKGQMLGVITHHDAKFIKSVYLFEKLILESKVYSWNEKAITVQHILKSKKRNSVVFECFSDCTFRKNGRIIHPNKVWDICKTERIHNSVNGWLDESSRNQVA